MRQRQREKEKRKKAFWWILRIALIIGIILLLLKITRCSEDEYTIELLGDNPQIINQGDDYKEEGYRFVDKDGNGVSKKKHDKLAKDVKIKGTSSINTMKLREYPVEYHYKKQVEIRIVRVVAKPASDDKRSNGPSKKEKSSDDEDADSASNSDSPKKQTDGDAKDAAKNGSANNGKSDDKSDSNSKPGSNKPGKPSKPGSNKPGKPSKPDEDKPGNPDDPTTPSKPEDKTPDLSGISFKDRTVVYDGTTHSIKIGGKIPAGVTVSYTYNGKAGNGAIDAGNYTVVAEIKYNNKVVKSIKATLTILKGDYNRDSFIFKSITVNYDGNEHSIFVDNASLQSGVRVDHYEGNGVKDIGIHTVKCFLVGDANNYNPIEPLTAQIIIKGTYDISEALKTFGDRTETYTTGIKYSITVDESKLPTGVTVSYTYNGKVADGATEAGEYVVEAKFSSGNEMYNSIPSVRATLTIRKGTYSITGITLPKQTKQYQKGVPQTLEIAGSLPANVTPIYSYDGDDPNHILPGRYNVSVRFVGDTQNYNPIGLTLNSVLTIEGQADDDDTSTDPDNPDINNPTDTDGTDVTNPDNPDINNPDGTEGTDVTDPGNSDLDNPNGTEPLLNNPKAAKVTVVTKTDDKKADELAAAKKAEEERKAAEALAAEEEAEAKKAAEEAAAKKAEEERKAAEAAAAKKAEEERKAAEAAAAKKAAEEQKVAEALAAKKAEEERKAAEVAAAKKAEEDRKAAEAAAEAEKSSNN